MCRSAVCIGDGEAYEWRLGRYRFLKQKINASLCNILYRLDNGGADILEVAKLPDSIKANYLYILWNSLMHSFQYCYDIVGYFIRHTENSLKG